MSWLMIAASLLIFTGQGPGTGSLTAARELYASARYDEALALLNGISPAESSKPTERKTIEQYRSLCLLALGRGEEAETAIAAVVTVDPFYTPSEAEASPRVRATFSDVRQRLLPDLTTARYAEAKQMYDRKQYAEAAERFRELVQLLDDPQMNGRQRDMRTLAAGFVELAAAAAAPPPEPKVEEPEPAPAPVPKGPPVPKIYTGDEPGIVAPATVRQDIPALPSTITQLARTQGLVDLVIDEKGRVVSIVLRTSLHPTYDKMIVNAAKDWKYKPATIDGRPVQFRKLLQIAVTNADR